MNKRSSCTKVFFITLYTSDKADQSSKQPGLESIELDELVDKLDDSVYVFHFIIFFPLNLPENA